MVELDSLDSSPTREDMEFSDPKVGRLLLCVDKRAAFWLLAIVSYCLDLSRHGVS